MKIDQDDMCDVDRYHPVSDHGFREYAILLTRVQAATSHLSIESVAARLTKFVQDSNVNPVYAETLVNLLMAQGYRVICAMDEEDVVYNSMAVRRIARNIGVTADVWQRTMEGHNSQAPEG